MDETTSVTTVVVALVVFILGVYAVMGDRTVAAAAAVMTTALLASREFLHGALGNFVGRAPICIDHSGHVVRHPAAGAEDAVRTVRRVDLAQVWMLAIVMATISFGAYVAVKVLGPGKGCCLEERWVGSLRLPR